MGKELAMVENNERGRMVRRYFIECERRLMETPAPALPSLSIEDRRPLSNLIGQWAGKAKISFPDCWRELHAVFNISTVAELPASQLPAALAWVQARIDALDKPDFPLELANCGKRGKDHVNLWTELEDLKKKLAHCNSVVFLACSSGRSMLLSSEKNLWHATLAEAVRHAQNCLEMAQQNVQTALRIKAQVDFHTI
jgi:hypothetical protein